MAEGGSDYPTNIPLHQFEDFATQLQQTPAADQSRNHAPKVYPLGARARGRGTWTPRNQEQANANLRPGSQEHLQTHQDDGLVERSEQGSVRVRRDILPSTLDDPRSATNQLPPLPHTSANSPLEQMMWNLLEDGRRREQTLMQLCQQALAQNPVTPTENNNTRPDDYSIPNYHIMPDLSKSIEDFHGEMGTSTAKEWIRTLEGMRVLHRWPDNFALEEARTHLKDGAKDWFKLRSSELTTWKSFYDAFTKSFIVPVSTTQRWRAMTERVQGPQEALTTYFYNKIKLCRELGLNMKEIKNQVLIGLWSRDLCNSMAPRSHPDADVLIHDMLEYEQLYLQRAERIKSARDKKQDNTKKPIPRAGFPSENTNKSPTTNTTGTNPDKRPPVRNTEGQLKCYNCNLFGHISKNCPEPRKELKCTKCNQTGHTQRHCKHVAVKADINNVSNSETDTTVNKYLKQVRINSNSVIALIDPGAAECTIKASRVIQFGFKVNTENVVLKSFGPQHFVIESPGYICANITVDEVTVKDIRLIIVPDDYQSVDALIGRTFTDSNFVDYHKVDNTLKFEYSECARLNNAIVVEYEGDDWEVVKRVELQPRAINFIEVLSKENVISVPVLNLSNKTSELQEQQIIPTVEIPALPGSSSEQSTKEPIIAEELHIGNDQPQIVVDELVSILNKYRNGVAKNISELGCTNLIEMTIDEIPNSKPVSRKPFFVSNEDREKTKVVLNEYRKLGIVTDTLSSYASPAFVINKKNGEPRVVVDYRGLNKQTVRIHFPLPNIDEQLSQIGDSTIFIILDLAMGYMQVPLAKESRAKTAFITADDTGEFTRMVFGLMNAPFFFSKLMERVLGPYRKDNVLFFLDDIMIPGKDWPSLKERFIKILEALVNAGLTINIHKCYFLQSQISFLGFEISAKGIQPGKNKLRAIIDFPTPTNTTEVRQFLGLVNFFRRFIYKFSEMVTPLYDLLKKDRIFEWTENQENAFRKVIQLLAKEPIVQPFQTARPTELHTDASSRGLAAMLMQKDEKGVLHLVYAISRKTDEAEKKLPFK